MKVSNGLTRYRTLIPREIKSLGAEVTPKCLLQLLDKLHNGSTFLLCELSKDRHMSNGHDKNVSRYDRRV